MNKSLIFFLICSFGILSCSKKIHQEAKASTETTFQNVYELSEMALLMEKMYADLKDKREFLLENKSVGDLPAFYSEMHTAKMTTDFVRNDEFEAWSAIYLDYVNNLHHKSSVKEEIAEYNKVINVCVACHQSDVGCFGPIERISKLLIPVQ